MEHIVYVPLSSSSLALARYVIHNLIILLKFQFAIWFSDDSFESVNAPAFFLENN